nr:methylsterol monooxygenase 1-1-like [Ipomoea batatas]
MQMIGIRTSLPLPSIWEIAAQLIVYFFVEDYTNYWIHRFLHCKWGYEKIHKVHHEYTAPIGFAAPYAHWAEILILGIPSFLGPAMVPCHIITFWLWIGLRQIEAIETHSGFKRLAKHGKGEEGGWWAVSTKEGVTSGFSWGWGGEAVVGRWYDLPWTPTKYIPFYGGPDYHDYHHYVGGLKSEQFCFSIHYCDYIYGTDKGYRYQKKALQQIPPPSLVKTSEVVEATS